MLFREIRNTDSVRWIQLTLEEGTTGVDYVRHLEHGGGRQQLAYGDLSHPNVAGVHEIDHPSHCRRTDLCVCELRDRDETWINDNE